jgi:hypothetical protein
VRPGQIIIYVHEKVSNTESRLELDEDSKDADLIIRVQDNKTAGSSPSG